MAHGDERGGDGPQAGRVRTKRSADKSQGAVLIYASVVTARTGKPICVLGVAGPLTSWYYFVEKAVLLAVDTHFDDFEIVARGFAFNPKFIA